MTSNEMLISKYPRLYHMAEQNNWGNVQKHGLLSTSALLDLFEYTGQQRSDIESKLREKAFTIKHPTHGEAVIRDQQPLCDIPNKGIYLDNCLDGVTRQEWFEILNERTFFWADEKGLNIMLHAVLYRDRSHYVITVDTRKLLERHAGRITLSSINSGSIFKPEKRSRRTFRPLSDYPSMAWVREVAVDYSVPDILELAISVDECNDRLDNVIQHIWPCE